jgi:hypothetical protein
MLGNAISTYNWRHLGAACSPRSPRLWNVVHTFYNDGAIEYLEYKPEQYSDRMEMKTWRLTRARLIHRIRKYVQGTGVSGGI